MATSFDDIEDKCLILIQDYRLDKLALNNPSAFKTYLDGLLIRAIPKFEGTCFQPLDYTNRTFSATLTNLEQEIIATFMEISWMTEITQDITQMQNRLQNKEFKTYSEAENLKQKSEYLDRMREKARQLITQYQLINFDKISFNG